MSHSPDPHGQTRVMRGQIVLVVTVAACVAGVAALFTYLHAGPQRTRIVLYGDSLSMQSAQDRSQRNVVFLNTIYRQLAAANHASGVTFTDAGQSVVSNGQFTWRLPASPTTGITRVDSPFGLCNVYSSGAYRFATAMLDPALGRPGGSN